MMFLTVQLLFAQETQEIGIWKDPCEDLIKKAKLSVGYLQLAIEAMNLADGLHQLAVASGIKLAIQLTEASLSFAMDVVEIALKKANEDVEELEDCRELYPDPPYFFHVASNGCVSGGCLST